VRSEILCEFDKKVSELNLHLSHTLFVFSQFRLDNKDLVQENMNGLTTEVYLSNLMSSQFNVKMKDIFSEADASQDYILDTFFVFLNTRFEVFLINLYNFIRDQLKVSSLPVPPDRKIYQTVLERLGIDAVTDLGNLNVSTYDYYKYRRNATMHRDKKKRFHGALEDLVKGTTNNDLRPDVLNGIQLNNKWKKFNEENPKAHAIKNIDFTAKDLSRFSLDELLDVFNFYRLFAKAIDKIALDRIDGKKFAEYLLSDYRLNYPDFKTVEYDKFAVRFRRISQIRLNLTFPDDDVAKLFKKL
jgi:hypothetical protein